MLDTELILEVLEFRGKNGLDTKLSPANAIALVEYIRQIQKTSFGYVTNETIRGDIKRLYSDGAEYSIDA